VPYTKYFNGRLRLKIKFDKYPDYVVETEKEVYIEHDSIITFVETDKPVYKAGQDVNIRILMLKHDLKPWKKTVRHIHSAKRRINFASWYNNGTITTAITAALIKRKTSKFLLFFLDTKNLD